MTFNEGAPVFVLAAAESGIAPFCIISQAGGSAREVFAKHAAQDTCLPQRTSLEWVGLSSAAFDCEPA